MILKIPFKILKYDKLDSTMTEAHRLIESHQARHGHFIIAREQTHGKGRLNRHWISSSGNFMGSLILNVPYSLFKTAEISFVAALTVGETIKSFIPNNYNVCYKWPNDVLVNQCKIAGILLEALESPQVNRTWLIVGIGINIQSFPENTTIPATCLKGFTKEEIDCEQVQTRFFDRFQNYFQTWCEQGFSPIRQVWLKDAASHGKSISVINGNETLTGKFVDLDLNGRLVIEMESGEIKQILAGDVYFPELRIKNLNK